MADAADVDVAEVQCLRQEITTRITLLHALVALELAALGAGLTLGGASAYVLAGLAAISSFMWLLWMDQSLWTYKTAAYLAIEVAPRLTRQVSCPVLGWETFLRRIDRPGVVAERALYPGGAGGRPGLVRSGLRADLYAPFLFGGTPPLLLTLYALSHHAGPGAVWAGCLTAGLMWLYAISRFTDFMHNVKVLNNAITEAASQCGSVPAPALPPEYRQAPPTKSHRSRRAQVKLIDNSVRYKRPPGSQRNRS